MARARDTVVLAWRTAYYGRVKQMPDLSDELDQLAPAAEDGAEVDEAGHMSQERHARLRRKMIAGVLAWNAKLSAEGAAGG